MNVWTQPANLSPPMAAGLFRWLRNMEAAGADLLDDRASGLRARIKQPAMLSFAPREVVAAKRRALPDGACLELTVRHFGLFAPYGPLPISTTELALEQQIGGPGPVLEDFASLFTTRPAIYYYRAWSQLAPVPSHERADDRFAARLASAAGLSPHSHAVVKRARMAFGGLYLRTSRSARDLGRLVTAVSGRDTRVIASVPGAVEASHIDATPRLGSAMLGKRGFDAEHRIRLDVHIDDTRALRQWYVGSEAAEELRILVDDYLDARKIFEVDLTTPRSPAAVARFGQTRLGRVGWLHPSATLLRRRLGCFGGERQE
ncbi:MAG TPA: type VI secretion system baseplate subunit TssG [Dyella sp.]|uniref:type VI secretion system baseplate subunit TssG n=1 Tax=Dyella sp. TaxID=1869338 RepID=UPI002F94F367